MTDFPEDLTDNEFLGIQRMRIHIGDRAKVFMNSDLGVYITERAQADKEAAEHLFKDVNPHDPKAIMDLQNKIKVPELAIQWLLDAIDRRDDILRENEEHDDADTIEYEEEGEI